MDDSLLIISSLWVQTNSSARSAASFSPFFWPVLGDSHFFFMKIVDSDYHNHFKEPLRFSFWKKKILINLKSFSFLGKKVPIGFQSYQFS
jgi:hypothetical protein